MPRPNRTPTIPGSLSTDRSRADYCLRHRFSCLIITRGCKRCQEWKAYFIGSFPRFYGIFGGVRCYLDMGMVKSWYLIRKRKGSEIMGRFVNPDNSAFQVALNSEIYVDKTGLLSYTNKVLDTMQGYICNSRPRRFGKSFAANMLAAYYSKGCDSRKMFSGLAISQTAAIR